MKCSNVKLQQNKIKLKAKMNKLKLLKIKLQNNF